MYPAFTGNSNSFSTVDPFATLIPLIVCSVAKNRLLFNLQNCNFESKITCWISDKTNGPVLRSFCSAYSMGYSILPPHSIFCLNWDDHVFRSINLQIVFFFSDSAVIVLVKNSIPGRLLFYLLIKSRLKNAKSAIFFAGNL